MNKKIILTLLLSPARKDDALRLYGVSGIPTVILIAPDGKVISTNLEGKALKAKKEYEVINQL